MPTSVSLRWIAVSVFVLSSTLNYLDRNLLGALSPLTHGGVSFQSNRFRMADLRLFRHICVSALAAGWVLDRFGVNRSMFAAVSWWSSAAVGTGLVRGLAGLGVAGPLRNR